MQKILDIITRTVHMNRILATDAAMLNLDMIEPS